MKNIIIYSCSLQKLNTKVFKSLTKITNINIIKYNLAPQKRMSSQKKSLETILIALIPYRNLAEWFLTIMKESEDEELENQILQMINKWIKSIKSEHDRMKIKKKIKELEKKNSYENEKDKKEAEFILNNFINNIE